MNFSNIHRSFSHKLVFISNYLINRDDRIAGMLSKHVGKVLEINLNNFLLRLIIGDDGALEVYNNGNNSSSMTITCNEPIVNVFKSINIYDFSALSKFMHISGDLQFMSDISVVLHNIEISLKDKFHKIIECLMVDIAYVHNNIHRFSSNLSSNSNKFFCNKLNCLANKSAYQDFENDLQSMYINIKKIHIRLNNLCNSVNNLINLDC